MRRPQAASDELVISADEKSQLQRKALTPNDFPDLDALATRITAFEDHYREIAQPFDWTFARTDLDRVLAKISKHEPALALAA